MPIFYTYLLYKSKRFRVSFGSECLHAFRCCKSSHFSNVEIRQTFNLAGLGWINQDCARTNISEVCHYGKKTCIPENKTYDESQ